METNREVAIYVGGTFYSLPKDYWGSIVGLILKLEKPLAKIERDEGYIPRELHPDAEMLKVYIQLRHEGLNILGRGPTEHTTKEIDWAYHDIVVKIASWGPVLESKEYRQSEAFQAYEDMLLFNAEKSKFTKDITYPLVRQLQEKDIYTLHQLDWLNYFQESVVINSFDTLSQNSQKRYNQLKSSIPDLKPKQLEQLKTELPILRQVSTLKKYYIIPELLDWNFYLDIRGPIPEGFKYHEEGEIPYGRLLDILFQWKKKIRKEEIGKDYLKEHPEAIPVLLEDRIPPDAPIMSVSPSTLQLLARKISQSKTKPTKEDKVLFEKALKLSEEKGISPMKALKIVKDTQNRLVN